MVIVDPEAASDATDVSEQDYVMVVFNSALFCRVSIVFAGRECLGCSLPNAEKGDTLS